MMPFAVTWYEDTSHVPKLSLFADEIWDSMHTVYTSYYDHLA